MNHNNKKKEQNNFLRHVQVVTKEVAKRKRTRDKLR